MATFEKKEKTTIAQELTELCTKLIRLTFGPFINEILMLFDLREVGLVHNYHKNYTQKKKYLTPFFPKKNKN